MKTVNVGIGGGYDIIVGPGLLAQTGERMREMGFGDRLAVITDSTVSKLYGDSLTRGLTDTGFKVAVLNGPENEEEKSLETAARLYQELTDFYAERSTPVLALGGGVIGDVAGFVAATYLRGVPLIQLPTTLLAQADSSIGGKTAVNHGSLKNKIGAFYQPRLTISDTETLKTLSPEQMSEGLAEIIKHGAIRDAGLFAYLEDNMEQIRALNPDTLETIVARSAMIKAEVVEQDELDLGLRNILNFGHTIGHAIESASEYAIGHGQAVAIGMVAAARLSNLTGYVDTGEVVRLATLLTRAGLPTEVQVVDTDRLLEAMQHDKKIVGGRVKFVLLRSIGEVFVSQDTELSLVRQVLMEKP